MQRVLLNQNFADATKNLNDYLKSPESRHHDAEIREIIKDINNGFIRGMAELLPRLSAIVLITPTDTLKQPIGNIEKSVVRVLQTLLPQAAKSDPSLIPELVAILSMLKPDDRKSILLMNSSDKLTILVNIARHNAQYALPILQTINQLHLNDKRELFGELCAKDLYNLTNAAYGDPRLAVALLDYFDCLKPRDKVIIIRQAAKLNLTHPGLLMLAARHYPGMIKPILLLCQTGEAFPDMTVDVASKIFTQKSPEGYTAYELAIVAGHTEGAEQIRLSMAALHPDIAPLPAASVFAQQQEVTPLFPAPSAPPLSPVPCRRLMGSDPDESVSTREEEEGLDENEEEIFEEEILFNVDEFNLLKHGALSPYGFFNLQAMQTQASATHKDNDLLTRLTELTRRSDWTVSGDETSRQVSIILQSQEELSQVIGGLIGKMDLQIVPNDKQIILTGSKLNFDALECSQPGTATMAF